ncbi:MAG: hypothetical protein KC609_22515 [Myxococcales bacterium]|nr:hypothetical protein [Myxococcales bacterium]
MIRRLYPAVFALALLVATNALAQVIDERDEGTRIRVDKDEGTRLKIVKDDEPEPPKPERSLYRTPENAPGYRIQARSRYVFIPGAILSRFFSVHPNLHSFSTAVEFVWQRKGSYDLVVSLDYTNFSFPDGNWLRGGPSTDSIDLPFRETDFARVRLHFISVDATFVWPWNIGRYVRLFAGLGIGVGVLFGTVRTTDVLPTCQAPVSQCQHWRSVTTSKRKLPSPVWPVINAMLGFNFRYRGFQFTIESGFRNVLFVGGSLGYKL